MKRRNEPDYPYPYKGEDGRENLEDGDSERVLRGGSFNLNQAYARAAPRYSNMPASRYYELGFRVVGSASAPISPLTPLRRSGDL